jgi:hypothetical protein
VKIETDYFVKLGRAQTKAAALAIRRFADFAARAID